MIVKDCSLARCALLEYPLGNWDLTLFPLNQRVPHRTKQAPTQFSRTEWVFVILNPDYYIPDVKMGKVENGCLRRTLEN